MNLEKQTKQYMIIKTSSYSKQPNQPIGKIRNSIKWFNLLKDKHLMKLVMFDIKDFYPSITQDLLNKKLNFASEYIYISKFDIDNINHARKSLMFDVSNISIKKQGGLLMCRWVSMMELKCVSSWAYTC